MDSREVHLDLRLVPAALTSWAVTAAGILWSIGVVVVALAVTIAAATVAAWWADAAAGHVAGVRMTAAGTVAVASVGLGFAIAVSYVSTRQRHHPIVDRYGTVAAVIVTPSEIAAVAGRRQDDVPRIAADRRRLTKRLAASWFSPPSSASPS